MYYQTFYSRKIIVLWYALLLRLISRTLDRMYQRSYIPKLLCHCIPLFLFYDINETFCKVTTYVRLGRFSFDFIREGFTINKDCFSETIYFIVNVSHWLVLLILLLPQQYFIYLLFYGMRHRERMKKMLQQQIH